MYLVVPTFLRECRDNKSFCVEKGERKKPFDYTRVQEKTYTV